MKTILKLAVAGLLVYAGWNIAHAWMSYFKFKDEVTAAAQTGFELSIEELHNRVLEIAVKHEVPVAADGFTIRRDDKRHTFIDGSYADQVTLLPGFAYPWTFTWHSDTFVATPPTLKELVPEQK